MPELSSAEKKFILHWGEMGTRWGVNRTIAQIHALLHLSPNPVTAEDVRFSWMRLKNKQGLPSWFMGWVDEVEVVDDHTVKATLNEAAPGFIMVATIPYMGILDSKVLKEQGGTDAEDAVTADTATPWLDQNSAGSGPFVLKSWDRQAEIVMEANPNYWGEPPKVDRIVIKMVDDPTTAMQMMQRGDMDRIWWTVRLCCNRC